MAGRPPQRRLAADGPSGFHVLDQLALGAHRHRHDPPLLPAAGALHEGYGAENRRDERASCASVLDDGRARVRHQGGQSVREDGRGASELRGRRIGVLAVVLGLVRPAHRALLDRRRAHLLPLAAADQSLRRSARHGSGAGQPPPGSRVLADSHRPADRHQRRRQQHVVVSDGRRRRRQAVRDSGHAVDFRVGNPKEARWARRGSGRRIVLLWRRSGIARRQPRPRTRHHDSAHRPVGLGKIDARHAHRTLRRSGKRLHPPRRRRFAGHSLPATSTTRSRSCSRTPC